MVRLEHLPGCYVSYPRDLLGPGEELPEGVPEDIGIQVCVTDCPVAKVRRERALVLARERGWLTDEGWVWPPPEGESDE